MLDKKNHPTKRTVFPIEDILLLEPKLQKSRAKALSTAGGVPSRPLSSTNFGDISVDFVLPLIKIWTFLSVHGVALHIYPFTLDDFITAITSSEDEFTVILAEVFGGLLSLACSEWAKNVDVSTGRHPLTWPMPSPGSEDFPDLEKSSGQYLSRVWKHYDILTMDEKIAMDQWYKWRPGKYRSDTQSKRRKRGTNSKVAANHPANDEERLKAWEVALAGLIKDWFPSPEGDLDFKWRVLSMMLDKENHHTKNDMESSKNNLNGDEDSIKHEEESLKQTDSVMDDDKDSILRSMNESTQDNNSEFDDINDSINDGQRKRSVIAYAEFDEDDTDDLIAGTSNKPSSVSIIKEEKPVVVPKSRKVSKKKRQPKPVEFEALTEACQKGFSKLSTEDLLTLIGYLIDECVGESDLLRQFKDKLLEKSIDLRREKREIARELKQILHNLNTLTPSEPVSSTSSVEVKQNAGKEEAKVEGGNEMDVDSQKAPDDDGDDISGVLDSSMTNADAVGLDAASEHSGSDLETPDGRKLTKVEKLRLRNLKRAVADNLKNDADSNPKLKKQSKELANVKTFCCIV